MPARRPHATALLPGLGVLRRYERGWLGIDVLAGLTVAAYAVPQCMAYADVAGLPPVVGLWALVPAAVVYAVAGSSRRLSVGPETTTALLAASAVGPLAGGDGVRYATLAALLSLLVGGLCLLGGLARLGFLADVLSRPVLVGYLAGIAVIMIVGQLGRLTGAPVDGDGFLGEVGSFASQLDLVQLDQTAIGLAVLVFLVVLDQVAPRLPGPLLAVAGSAIVVGVTGMDVPVVGEIPAGLPAVTVPWTTWADIGSLLAPALGIAVVAYTDNILTARSFAARHGRQVDANQELWALGSANVGAGLLQGFPVSSSGSRTALADASGARTQAYSLVMALAVLVVVLFLRPALATFPQAALAGLVMYAALRLIEVGEFVRLRAFRLRELWLALATLVGVLVFGILPGVLVAVALSVIELMTRVARPHDAVLGRVPGLAGLHDVEDHAGAVTMPGLVVYRYDAPLCFANADDLRTRAMAAVEAEVEPVRWFVLNAEANTEVDITAADALELLRAELEARGITFALARVKTELRAQLDRAGFLQRVGPHDYPTLPTAVEAYQHAEGRRWPPVDPPPPS